MKEKYELIPLGDKSYLIRKFKKHFWNRWETEMDGKSPKAYPVDQENCEHDFQYLHTTYTVSYPAGIPVQVYSCRKCGKEKVKMII